MRCWNCGRVVSKRARVCQHCEADLTEAPSADEEAAVAQVLASLPPDILAQLLETMSQSTSAEEFANRILVGPCPTCGSEQTGHCDADPEINELLVGRCYECGHLWCTECGNTLTLSNPQCGCWHEDE
jgi:zinc-ribbon domain